MRILLAVLLLSLVAAADDLEDGRALLGTKEQAKGVALIRKGIAALEEQPATAESRHRIGLGYFWVNEDRKALTAFAEAAKLAPKAAKHPFMMGVVWMYSDLGKAEEWFQRAAKLDPESADIQFELGRVARLRKQPDVALRYSLRSCELNPKHIGAHLQAGGLLMEKDQADDAIKHFDAVIAIDPANALALYNAGQLRYNREEFEKALAHWAAGAKAQPGDFGMQKKAVQACYALGRPADAKPHKAALRKIRAAAPKDKRPDDYCFDQFDAGEYRVLAYETFDTTGDLVYHLVFRVYDKRDKLVRTVNLESSDVIRGLGVQFILGGSEGDVHKNYGITFKAMPAYAELKKLVVDAAVDGKVER